MRNKWFFFCLLPFFDLGAEPVTLEKAVLETRQDVQQSTRELNSLREEIRQERLPMAEKLSALQTRAAELRREVRQIRNAQRLRENQRQDLERKVQRLEEENEFVETVVEEYRRSMSTRVHIAEYVRMQEQLPREPDQLFPFLRKWYETRSGGYTFSGQVLDNAGRANSGQFLIFGPVGYFINPDLGGWVVSRSNSFLPGLYEFTESPSFENLQMLSEGSEGKVPVDVSGGNAIKVREARPSLTEHVKQGGVMVIPLLILGVLAFFLALRKAFDLNRLVVKMDSETRSTVQSVCNKNEIDVLRELQGSPQPLSSLLSAGIQHRKASREHLEEILHEHVLAVVPRLERSLGILAVFGGVAPLLGLLGTVTGMIHTFQLVTIFGSGNAKTLSGGISEALVTTEIGLIIAIPILLVHAFLARKAKNLLGELEQTGVSLTNLIKSPVADSE